MLVQCLITKWPTQKWLKFLFPEKKYSNLLVILHNFSSPSFAVEELAILRAVRKLDWSLNLENNLLKSIQYFLIESFLNCASIRLRIANVLEVIIPRDAYKMFSKISPPCKALQHAID